MSIKREDLDAGRVNFADVASGRRLAPIHPGEILRVEFLEPMKISVYTLAQVIKVPRSRVNDIVLGRRGITTDTAPARPILWHLGWSSGSTCRRVTTWKLRIERYAAGLSGRSLLALLDCFDLAVRDALESAGVEFIDENGGSPSVRLRQRQRPKPPK